MDLMSGSKVSWATFFVSYYICFPTTPAQKCEGGYCSLVGRKISKYPNIKCGRDDGDINLLNDSADWILYFLGIHMVFWVFLGKWGKPPLNFNGMEELYQVGL